MTIFAHARHRLIVALTFLLLPTVGGVAEVSILIDFTRITPDAELNGVPVNRATLLETDAGYRSYLADDWRIASWNGDEPGPDSISVQRVTVEPDAMTYFGESCMRVTASIDDQSPGFTVSPPFPPDLSSSRLEVTESGEVMEIAAVSRCNPGSPETASSPLNGRTAFAICGSDRGTTCISTCESWASTWRASRSSTSSNSASTTTQPLLREKRGPPEENIKPSGSSHRSCSTSSQSS